MTKDEMRKIAEAKAAELETPIMRDDSTWLKEPYANIMKCGVLPYRLVESRLQYYLFEPGRSKPELGPPGFQIPKGTREIFDGKEWVDYQNPNQLKEFGEDKIEDLKVTALREGIEEIGLPVDAIERGGEWGQAAFQSATTGGLRTMWLYPIQMKADTMFTIPNKIHANTIARDWFDIQVREQAQLIRPDHLQAIKKIDEVLRKEIFSGVEEK